MANTSKFHSDNLDTSRFCADCGTRLFPGDDFSVSQTENIEALRGELTRGTTLADRYEIIEELGKGGMGRVCRFKSLKI